MFSLLYCCKLFRHLDVHKDGSSLYVLLYKKLSVPIYQTIGTESYLSAVPPFLHLRQILFIHCLNATYKDTVILHAAQKNKNLSSPRDERLTFRGATLMKFLRSTKIPLIKVRAIPYNIPIPFPCSRGKTVKTY